MNGIYLQPIYVYYAGNGTTRYFTAKDAFEAKEFLENEDLVMEELSNKIKGSAFPTVALVQATKPFWLKHGIVIASNTNLLEL